MCKIKDTYLEHLDFYEVDRADAVSYIFRLKARPQMKLTPQENLEVSMDIETRQWLYGIETINLMGQKAKRYFIFEFLDDNLLGPHRTVKKIELPYEQYEEFIKRSLGEYDD